MIGYGLNKIGINISTGAKHNSHGIRQKKRLWFVKKMINTLVKWLL